MKLHLGIGHYGIGFKDGVNTVISRNVRALMEIDRELKITLFGKLSPDYRDFIEPVPGRLEYLNIDEFDPASPTGRIKDRSIVDQQVHDYVWQGTNLVEILVEKCKSMDVIMTENLGIGIDPSVTYAFYLYAQYCYTRREPKLFIYRCHDFVQQRPVNFKNVKKFYELRFGAVPHWHSVLYPAFSNIRYIAINRYDRSRLFEHGIEERNVYHIPNSVDRTIIPEDDRGEELGGLIRKKEGLDPETRFILYPVRCVRRKNVEEAIFLTKLFNIISKSGQSVRNHGIEGKYHLLVSIRPTSGNDASSDASSDASYATCLSEFSKGNNLPVTIGLEDIVGLEREYAPQGQQVLPEADGRAGITRYGIGDLYMASELVITTSILEGFGFVYIEPWLLERAVIGRSIPYITPDFQASGMKLGHLYNALIVNRHDYKDIGTEEEDPNLALEKRLEFILRLESPGFIEQFIENNETSITATIRLFDPGNRRKVIEKNREVVEDVYSQETVGRKLYDLITASG
jgi:glycosyltransferase involved in cell wall biosynthesis